MSEETTKNLGGEESFETRVLSGLAAINNRLSTELSAIDNRLSTELAAINSRLSTELAAVNNRLSTLEEKVDARLHDTRPIWEAVLTRLDLIDAKMDALASEMLTMRGEINLLKKRVPPAA